MKETEKTLRDEFAMLYLAQKKLEVFASEGTRRKIKAAYEFATMVMQESKMTQELNKMDNLSKGLLVSFALFLVFLIGVSL